MREILFLKLEIEEEFQSLILHHLNNKKESLIYISEADWKNDLGSSPASWKSRRKLRERRNCLMLEKKQRHKELKIGIWKGSGNNLLEGSQMGNKMQGTQTFLDNGLDYWRI